MAWFWMDCHDAFPKLIALALVLWTVWKVFQMIERRKKWRAARP